MHEGGTFCEDPPPGSAEILSGYVDEFKHF